MKLKPFDLPAVIAASAAAVFSAFIVYGGGSGELRVVVESGGRTWVYPLNSEETLRVPGPIGETVVHIHEGKVAVEASPCENQTCVAAGSVDSNGQWVACLPNAVFVRVEGKERDDAPDALSR